MFTSSMGDSQASSIVLCRLTSNIQSEDRRKRKSALDEFFKIFFKDNSADIPLETAVTELQKNLFKCLYDQSEAVRDSSINVINELIQRIEINEEFLSELISILLWRLGENEVNEPSEEIRLRLVTMTDDVISKVETNISPFAGDLVQILTRTLIDSYPKVRQMSCKCAGNLASTAPRNFYDHSNKLIKPILASFNHQHFRMRVAAIEALGKVVRYGNTKNLPTQEVFGSLAERLFDSNPSVRLAVTKVIGDWLVNMYDRYSFFTKMIPLILTSLCDELPELRQEAWEIWSKAGLQYEQENEQDLKEKMDFLSEKPDHYPPGVLRPNLGCRTLVQRNTCQITPALSRELEDWKNDIRIKSAQLLCWLVLHAETDITQHTETLLTTMYKACNQTDPRIVDNVEKAAEYIAYFVPPDTYMKLLLQVVEDSCTAGHLCVLSALIRGTKLDLLQSHFDSITDLLSTDNICRNRNAVYQFQLLKCCEALLNSGNSLSSENAEKLFITIVTVKALSSKKETDDYSQDMLVKLSDMMGYSKETKLYEYYTGPLFKKMSATVDTWTSVSYDHQILYLILEEGGSAIGVHLSDIISVLKSALKVDGDPIVKSKFFTSLSTILSRRHLINTAENYQEFIKSLIHDCICPNLVWHAGRSAEALRTVVLACLCAALLPQDELAALFNESDKDAAFQETNPTSEVLSKEIIEEIFTNLFPHLINTIEDSAVKSRLFSLKLLQNFFRTATDKGILTPDHVNQAYPMLLKRLDDVSDSVRKEAVKTLTVLYQNLPSSYHPDSFKPHLESLFGTMLIHLDDPDPNFQELMMDALKTIGKVSPRVLYDKLDLVKERFRNNRMCNEILQYLKEC
ncbi:UNVERIFIED_CONTAM: hypothetical protein PYX00_000222 [Menopon gallinae]|uniref:TOG domain-containing protein n=1 Tax=Menopon gallinae TaxID=328185 RepID=A0AAW2I8B8_9NEOP